MTVHLACGLQAGSPDEAALVVAAKVFGFFFHARTPHGVKVRETNSMIFWLLAA